MRNHNSIPAPEALTSPIGSSGSPKALSPFTTARRPLSIPCLSSHQLQLIIRRPPRLRKTQTPLYTLQKLSRHLITHNMRRPLITLVQLFSCAPLVDPHHRHTDRPCAVHDDVLALIFFIPTFRETCMPRYCEIIEGLTLFRYLGVDTRH